MLRGHRQVRRHSLHLLQAGGRDARLGAARQRPWVGGRHLDVAERRHDGGQQQQALVGDASVAQREEAEGGEGEGGEWVKGVAKDGERG